MLDKDGKLNRLVYYGSQHFLWLSTVPKIQSPSFMPIWLGIFIMGHPKCGNSSQYPFGVPVANIGSLVRRSTVLWLALRPTRESKPRGPSPPQRAPQPPFFLLPLSIIPSSSLLFGTNSPSPVFYFISILSPQTSDGLKLRFRLGLLCFALPVLVNFCNQIFV